jgi:hypothetical protein
MLGERTAGGGWEVKAVATIMILKEYDRAVAANKPFNSAHEGWAVLKEEVDELWDEVKKNAKNRDPEKMLKEAVQVAAMGLRFIVDVCLREGKGE